MSTISSHGYVLIYVGKDHHLADVRGYAYEHRIVAEKKLGRRLRKGELVHHLDENPQNNDPSNLEVKRSVAEHRFAHRRIKSNKREFGAPNPTIKCKCGCGVSFKKFDKCNRPRKYVSGHNMYKS
jgi:hypothetical protein